ncbi:tRNA synthetases class I, catalytic domain-containing protein [Pelagophyceae sp. CCMP2097]|nr:tRNA synthetases class I, catalytic domain-containing protein [Pelagophyceae sp. CCMP2097]|mmetsp:Transcript_6036/g.21492  ORF Transcript_6036/g.21492 Transcript_6036/m.21492 type:complete len:717 (+) Transcript_6036:83-2233(+)
MAEMGARAWYAKSPSARWLQERPAPEAGTGSRGVWDLDRGKDPLLGRTLTHWPEAATENGPQRCGNTEALLEEHHRINGAAVRTRFPPEPNGYLHIGHAKSMNMNFHLAFERLEAAGVTGALRETVFRFDDTNPEAESKEFVESLRRDVEWMGWQPAQTTYASEYFDVLYALALELVHKGKAYVCHQNSAAIEACRNVSKARTALKAAQAGGGAVDAQLVKEAKLDQDQAHESPFRDRPLEENLRLFGRMRRGLCKEGECTLRMKMDVEAANYNMFDQVAYRVKYVGHPHVGDLWCVYPTYDFTHCIVDALEHVDYSICTLEFETRRESYYWVLDALDLYRPKVFEMSRLNIAYTVLSKRKLTKLVVAERVRGWDDPRMPTISGLRRRGYTREAINNFCRDVGVTRNENFIDYSRLEHFVRLDLEPLSPRVMAIKKPLICVLAGDEKYFEGQYAAPHMPTDLSRGTRPLALTRTVYLDADDFQASDSDDFFGLAPGKWVRLRYCCTIFCDSFECDASGAVVKVLCTVGEAPGDPRGKLHWVSESDALRCEIRDYDYLFTCPKVDNDNWESQLSPTSEVVHLDAVVDKSVLGRFGANPGLNPPPRSHLQFERLGFYVVDDDTTPDKLIFNRVVELKSAKPAEKKAGASRKDEQAAQAAKKAALKKVDPTQMFKSDPLFSLWDAEGVPTHLADGEAVSKSNVKKLKKDWLKQKKLFES